MCILTAKAFAAKNGTTGPFDAGDTSAPVTPIYGQGRNGRRNNYGEVGLAGPGKSNVSTLVRKRPLLSFFVLTYFLSWIPAGCYISLSDHVDALRETTLPGTIIFYMATYSPALVSLVLIYLLHGGGGVRAFGRRLLRWDVPLRWYTAIVIVIPLLFLAGKAASVALGRSSPSPPASDWFVLPFLSLSALITDPGPMEEIGWRGFALPLLQARCSALTSSVVLGVLWALWHMPVFIIFGLEPAYVPYLYFSLSLVLASILMTTVYNSTGGSIPLMCLFHWQFNDPLGFRLYPDDMQLFVLLLLIAAGAVVILKGPVRLAKDKVTDYL